MYKAAMQKCTSEAAPFLIQGKRLLRSGAMLAERPVLAIIYP
jgi:hypothetical protein